MISKSSVCCLLGFVIQSAFAKQRAFATQNAFAAQTTNTKNIF